MTTQARAELPTARSAALVAFFVLAYACTAALLARAPDRYVFDEVWYAGQCANDGYADVLQLRDHPPLGFAIVCSGIRVFGEGPFGWRVASVVMGAASVAVLLAILVRLRVRLGIIAVAGALLVTDPLLLVLGRLSMLDTPLLFFFALSTAFFLRSLERPASELRWLVACGVAIGAACAVKWSGALLPVVFFGHYALHQRDYQEMRIDWRAVAALGLLPILVFVGLHLVLGFTPAQFIEFVRSKIVHHVAYSPYGVVPITSRMPEWLLLQKPVPLLPVQLAGAGGPIIATGNPFGYLAVFGFCFVALARAELRRRVSVALLILLAFVQLAAWAAAPRITFLYYLVTIVPFALLAFADGIGQVAPSRALRVGLATLVVLHVGYSAYLWPVLAGTRVPARWAAAYTDNPLISFAVRATPAPAASRAAH